MNKKTIMISQTTFLLCSEFLLVNFREAVDEGDGQHVGDQDRCHRVKEGNRSGGVLYHGLGFYGSRLARRVASGEIADTSNWSRAHLLEQLLSRYRLHPPER